MKWFVKIHLRTLQIGINVWTILAGFCTFLPLGYTWKYFKWNCFLYAHVVVTANKTGYVSVDMVGSAWTRDSVCDFTLYGSVVAVMHAFIWLWFFLLMKAMLKADSHEYYMQLPSFLLHSIMSFVLFVSSSIISAGANSFCSHLTKALDNRYTCSEAAHQPWDIFVTNNGQYNAKHNFYAFLILAKVASWLMTVSLLGQSLLSGFKLYKWFLKDNPEYKRDRTKVKDEDKSKTIEDKSDTDSIDSKDSILFETEDS